MKDIRSASVQFNHAAGDKGFNMAKNEKNESREVSMRHPEEKDYWLFDSRPFGVSQISSPPRIQSKTRAKAAAGKVPANR